MHVRLALTYSSTRVAQRTQDGRNQTCAHVRQLDTAAPTRRELEHTYDTIEVHAFIILQDHYGNGAEGERPNGLAEDSAAVHHPHLSSS